MASCYLNRHLSYLDSVWACLPSENTISWANDLTLCELVTKWTRIVSQVTFVILQSIKVGEYFRNGGELRMGPSYSSRGQIPVILIQIHWWCLARCLRHRCFRAHLFIPTSLWFQFRPFWNFCDCQVGNSLRTRWAPYMGPCKTHRCVEPWTPLKLP